MKQILIFNDAHRTLTVKTGRRTWDLVRGEKNISYRAKIHIRETRPTTARNCYAAY